MSNKIKIIGVERQPRSSGGPRTVYVCECLKCSDHVKIRKGEYYRASGLCNSCSHKKKPFESQFNCLKRGPRKDGFSLTYEQFLEFTEIKNCYYCDIKINWVPYGTEKGKFISHAYYLDRKDNDGPYSKENCVVCCTQCNKLKRTLSHDIFINKCRKIANNLKLCEISKGGKCNE